MKTKFAVLFFLCSIFVAEAQSLQQLNAEGTAAYQSKDFARFLSLQELMNQMRPSHPTVTYNLACAYALNGNSAKAIETLRKCVLMNSKVDFEKDTDLASIQSLPEYAKVVQLKSELGKTIAQSQKIVSLAEKDLHPEGILYLSKSKTWLATSIHKSKIVAFDIQTGACLDWLHEAKMLAVFSIKADAGETFLWAATAAMPEQIGFSKADEDKSEVLKIDIKTRKIVRRFPLQGSHVFGDLEIARNGTVYISDSSTPIVYQIKNDSLSEFVNLQKEAFSLQGITLNAKQDKIYLADYLKGILEIPINNPQQTNWLIFPEDTTVKGIDGLLWYENSLLAIHNGVKPIRIIRYFLDANGTKITNHQIIDHNRTEFNEPALGTVVGKDFYFFANNPWNAYSQNFTLDDTRYESPMVFACRLKK